MHLIRHFFSLALIAGIVVVGPATGQVKLPKPPETYDVEFRYRIKAGRNERIVQFNEMQKFLKDLGFKRVVDEDSDLDVFDPTAERMYGTIPSATARRLLGEPHVQTVMLAPAGYKAAEGDRAKVLIELSGGFTLPKQRQFGLEVKQILATFGFQEAISYDHRGYTLLRGTMPAVRVPQLLKDLRTQPSGWFLPLVHETERPELLRSQLPIRLIEIQPEDNAPGPVMGQEPLPPIPPEQPWLDKLSADVRRQLATAKEGVPFRVELTFVFRPDPADNSWRERLRLANPGTTFEGLLGNVVTLTANGLETLSAMARLPDVESIRLPRAATLDWAPAADPKKDEPKENAEARRIVRASADEPFEVLKATRLDKLHAQGRIGTGQRIAIIDTDFSGWQKFVGKGLPATTHYVDLTAERNSAILPEPSATPDGTIGHGTHCALAVRLAAPDADIALVRVANDAPYEIITAYRAMLGEFFQPESFRSRREELEVDAGVVRGERAAANAQYRKAFDNFDDDEESREARRAARAAIAAVEQRERDLSARANRLLVLEQALNRLAGCRVVLNQLGWNSGQPLDATSSMARYLDTLMGVGRPNPQVNIAKQPQPTVWFQPAGDTRGQAWLGEFRDADGNGIMEFAPADFAPRKDRWTAELNFLAFRGVAGPDEADLPAGTRLRVSVQWREPHDPGISEAEYRRPIAPLNLLLLRQRDPEGEKLPSDELEVIARSEGNAVRLFVDRDFAVYEQSIDVVLPAAGRFAVRVDGAQPLGLRPDGGLGIRDQEVYWQFKPRLFVETADLATRSKGRVVLADYESQLGGVAVPGDARTVVAVGAAHANKRPEGFSALGAGLVSDLFIKPDVMTYDELPKLGDGTGFARGTALSASLATGIGASILSGGAESANFLRYLRVPPGDIFVVPDDWIRK